MTLPETFSPLALLEQRSRILATRLQKPEPVKKPEPAKKPEPVKKSSKKKPPIDFQKPLPDPPREEKDDLNKSTAINYKASTASEEFAQQGKYPVARLRVTPGNSRRQSTDSIGSILGSFRLSTISIIGKEQTSGSMDSGLSSHSPFSSSRKNSTGHIDSPSARKAHNNIYNHPVKVRSQSESRSNGITLQASKPRNASNPKPSFFRQKAPLNKAINNSVNESNKSKDSHANGWASFGLNRSVSASTRRTMSRDPSTSSLTRKSSMSSTSLKTTSDSDQRRKSLVAISSVGNSFHDLTEKHLNNNLTLEEQVSLGILHHEKGNLRDASYHWQCAAFRGELTGMLLYGLALRHGWGIRQNPAEAVKWIQKVVGPTITSHSLEDVLNPEVIRSLEEALLKKTAPLVHEALPAKNIKKAQIALALYELGVCYLNSWGIAKDEDMALRCFELAGGMGDVDALCEAATLWMHSGFKGRKKNLLRAAKLYRAAGEKGASMVSNSWIYKEKYMAGGKKPKK